MIIYNIIKLLTIYNMKNIEKYNWIIPIIEKHFLEMTKEIEREAMLKDKLLNYFRVGEIQEDLELTIANLVASGSN